MPLAPIRRSPGEIDDERRTAEQAGREAYAEAIRTGRDVQAQTPDELVQLGRARLAQQAGALADPGDEPPLTVALGLQKGVQPGPELGIRAGLAWLDAKSYIHDGAGRLGTFIGDERAFKRYNGGGDPDYWNKVQSAYRHIKSGGR